MGPAPDPTRAMWQQIKQVGTTYVTQRYLWWGLALVSLMVVSQFFIAKSPRRSPMDAAQPMLMPLGFPMLFALPFLVGQVKAQFAHSRARLMPHFLPAHLIVLCGILLTIIVLYPLLFASISRFEPLGLVALAIAIGVPAIWGAHLNRFAPLLVSLVVFYSLLTGWGLHWWIVDAPTHRPEHALIVLAGFCLSVAWLWRLSQLTEEMDDYQNVYQMLLARRTGSEAIEQRRLVATQLRRSRLMSWIGDAWHARLGGYYGGSKAGLARLLRYGFAANPVEVQGLFMAVMFLAMGLFFSQFSIMAKAPSNLGAVWFFVIFVIFLPGQMAGEMLAQRRPRLAFEMLLPLTRTQLIDGLFAAAARNSFVLWLMMSGAIAAIIAIVSDHVVLSAAATYLILSASATFAAIGVGLRISVWPSMAKRLIVAWLCWMVLIPPTMVCWTMREKAGDWPFVLIAVGFIAIGAWLIRAARRAWLNLELG